MSKPQSADPVVFPHCALVIVAAGEGRRFGAPKQLARIAGVPLLIRTMEAFESCRFDARVVVLPPSFLADGTWRKLQETHAVARRFEAVAGGAERALSVRAGLAGLSSEIEFVAIHDGARPFPPIVAARDCLIALRKDTELGAAIVCAPVLDTIKRVAGDRIARTENRDELRRAETPQICRAELLRAALSAPDADSARDDAEAIERLGRKTACVVHRDLNLKITHSHDLAIAETILKGSAE